MTHSLLDTLPPDEGLAHPKPNRRARRLERKRIEQQSKTEQAARERKAEAMVKELVRQRDRFRCRLCGERAYEVAHGFSEGAHPSARWLGENMVVACRDCHEKGHARPQAWLRAFEILIGSEVFARAKRVAQKPNSGPSAEDVIAAARHGLFWELPA